MTIDDYKQRSDKFLVKVYELSASGKLNWQKTADENTFLATIETSYVVRIHKNSEGVIILELLDQNNERLIEFNSYQASLIIYQIGQITISKKEVLKEIHQNAKIKAQNIVKKIDDVLKLLDKAEEDLPF